MPESSSESSGDEIVVKRKVKRTKSQPRARSVQPAAPSTPSPRAGPERYLPKPAIPVPITTGATLSTLHHKRGHAWGTITTAKKAADAINLIPIEKWRALEIRNLLDKIEQGRSKAETVQNEILSQPLEEETLETETETYQKFEDDLTATREMIEAMDQHLAVFRELYRVEKAATRLHAAGVDGTTEAQLIECKTDYKAIVRGNVLIEDDTRLERLSDVIATTLETISQRVEDDRPEEESSSSRESSVTPTVASPIIRERRAKRRLPEIAIPTFKGDIMKWPHFIGIFRRNVADNTELMEEEKIAYLQQAIQDERHHSLIDATSTVPGRFAKYLTSLEARYNQKRKRHVKFTNDLFNCKPCRAATEADLHELHCTLSNAAQSLEHTGQWTADAMATSYVEGLLPEELLTIWYEKEGDTQTVPPFATLLAFIEKQANLPRKARPSSLKQVKIKTEPEEKSKKYVKTYPKTKYQREVYEVSQATVSKPLPECKLCKESHYLSQCPTYQGYSIEQRLEYVKTSKRCSNCLNQHHTTSECRSRYTCHTCHQRGHHSSLHVSQPAARASRVQTVATAIKEKTARAIEPTLELSASNTEGQQTRVTALYDSGAAITLISKRVVDKLHLRQRPSDIGIVLACGANEIRNLKKVNLQLQSLHQPGKSIQVEATVIPMIGNGKKRATHQQTWPFLEDLNLADPHFRDGNRIDILLGTNITIQIREAGFRKNQDGSVMAEATSWGWVVTGWVVNPDQSQGEYVCQLSLTQQLLNATQEGNDLLKRFAASEEIPDEKMKSLEDEETLQHYAATHRILESGRFEVQLPRRPGHQLLGSSRQQAIRRFSANERALTRKGKLEEFQTVIREYFALSHAEFVPDQDLETAAGEAYYLPMHAVFKASSTTTKLRVVFDASATTTSGASLNDILRSGPTVYPLLIDIIMRFRRHSVVITADIAKMFREISLAPGDRNLHRFIWREKPEDPVRDCRMTRLTFGVTSSPFLATQTLQQIAENHRDTHPVASKALKEAFYVDDLITGASSITEAQQLRKELQDILDSHGLNLRKWRSNQQEVLDIIPEELCEQRKEPQPFGTTTYCKTLGIHWNQEKDEFHVSISELNLPSVITKRILTSDVAKTFDVLGWLTPTTVLMKMAIQQLWEEKIDWDQQVPAAIQDEWTSWREELATLAAHPISRPYFSAGEKICSIELHGFSDASLKAFAGVVYIRATYQYGPPTVALVTARSRVAPLKGSTIPRLELCGAEMLANLMNHTRKALGMTLDSVNCWIDSTIVLHWLDGKPRQLKTYVENRVRRSLELVPADQWNHVPGTENPADCASRGVLPEALSQHPLWWSGPPWLHEDPIRTPPQPNKQQAESQLMELKTVARIVAVQSPWMVGRFSSYYRLRRCVAWIVRFLSHVRKKCVRKGNLQLTVEDLDKAETLLFRQSQSRTLPAGRMDLWKNHKATKKLNPTLDDQGIVRVNGRLGNAAISYSQKFPVILQGSDSLTRIIIRQEHVSSGHGGPTLVMSGLGQRFYITRGMEVVKAICRKCVTCLKVRRELQTQQMGQLPPQRVNPGFPFQSVGTDFAGPITTKRGYTRKPVYEKTYICVFCCLATKAVHLETVSELTTAAFLASLDRFIGRRGRPHTIFSDNGSNFKGAAKELEEVFQLMCTEELQEAVQKRCADDHIIWKFSPARAPHFGGIWEAAVKAFKFHLRRILHQNVVNFEELNTILIRIESALNSRPLMPLHAHSTEGLGVLTPGHFLIGRPLTARPEAEQAGRTLSKRYNLIQELSRKFWERWSQDYLRQLHARPKWQKPRENIEVGDIVLVKGQSTFRANDWPLARVTSVHTGGDGLVRAVDVKTDHGVFRRAITELTILLRVKEEDESAQTEPPDLPLSPPGMLEFGTP